MLLTISIMDMIQIMTYMLEHDIFTVSGEYLLQICGTKMAPCYANIFMAELQETFCQGVHTNLFLIADVLTTSFLRLRSFTNI